MKKIPILEVVLSLGRGGRRNRVLDNLRALDRTRFAPILCTFQGAEEDRQIGRELRVPVHLVRRREGIDPSVILGLLHLIVEHKVRLLHVHDGSSELYGALAGRIAQVPIVSTFHRSLDFELGDTMRQSIVSRLIAARVAVSESRRQDLIRSAFTDAQSTYVIHGGADLCRFQEVPDGEREGLRREFGIGPDTPLLLAIGHYGLEKGHDVVLRALAVLRERMPATHLWISGTGSAVRQQELQRLVRHLGIANQVTFLGWRCDPERLLKACDLFVLAPRQEAFGLVFAEAAAAGRPVVATRVGGIPEVVEDGRTGLLVPPEDPPALGAAIAALLLESERRAHMGAAAQEVAAARFSIERMARQYEALFIRVLQQWERRNLPHRSPFRRQWIRWVNLMTTLGKRGGEL